eukprot:XP_001695776.1 sodium/phosphate symporter [Chlamydomonas reinhardtii]
MSLWTDYTWIVVCGALASFFTAYGIGANDVANAFGSSVAARTLTLRQALLIAAVCEFSGSVLLGGQVTRTVAGGIARLSTFERVPELYMFGMLCALVASGTWLLVATYLELPVSTTHSMIGAVLGFAFVYGGVEAVVWMQPTDRFPFMSGMVPIVLSWFTSPLLCGLATAALFVVLRSAVLRRENSLQLTYVLLPILVLLTVFVNCFFVLNKGASRELTWSIGQCAWVSAAAAGGCSLITVVALVPLLRRVVGKEEEKRCAAADGRMAQQSTAAAHDADASYDDADSEMESGGDHDRAQHSPSGAIVLHGTRVNVHDALETDMTAQAIHLAAEVFDPDTEYAFRYLQVITAMCDSFSHGANDVANAVGPFCAIWYIYNNMRIDYQADLPIWILVVGGAGIVVGLGTYGYNIIRAIGMRLSAITPARGFCIELATAVVVVVASNYGLPISTTHCQVGATAGMGLTEGSAGINWVLALQFFLGWVVTLLITGVLSAALFAAGAYAPSIIQERDVAKYEDTLLRLTAQLDSLLNRTNQAGVSDPATWGTYSAALQAKLQSNAAFLKDVNTPGTKSNTRPVQHLDADTMTAFLNSTVTTYLNNSLPYIGGMPAKGLVLPRDRGA